MPDADPANASRTEEREVTLLFADLRGFTELADSLEHDPLACELLAHVMECLSNAVVDHGGYIVDYFGDGLMAMWNAPTSQPNHAEDACRAALQILSSLPEVNHDWIVLTRSELRVGIGVHTGDAQVGNAGSARKAKYGPRGPNVNLASRVEAATKDLGIPFLATRATIERLPNSLIAYRVCRAQLPGLQQPVDLFAVRPPADDIERARAWQVYAEALRRFELGELDSAADALTSIDPAITDVPWRFLLDRLKNAQGRNQRRRDSDKPIALSNGVIPLAAK